jgi:ribosomal protein S8
VDNGINLLKYKGWWIKTLYSLSKKISKTWTTCFRVTKNFTDTIDVLRYEQGTAIISTSAGIVKSHQSKN